MTHCACSATHAGRRVVLTGGPGAGKTAVLELVRRTFCQHVHVLPEAAGIVFGGGFPRGRAPELTRPAQRAIFHVERELEATVTADNAALVLCDRGTVDGVAYWPGPTDFWLDVGTTLEAELARYAAVVHLRTPTTANGYNRSNPLRVESAEEAAAIDERIAQAWRNHPKRFEISSTDDFFEKASRAVEIIRGEVPACCRSHFHALAMA